MSREMNRWSGFSLGELLALYVTPHEDKLSRVLNHELNSEIDRRYLERAEKASKKPEKDERWLEKAMGQVGLSKEAAPLADGAASKDEVFHLREAVRALIVHLAGGERSS